MLRRVGIGPTLGMHKARCSEGNKGTGETFLSSCHFRGFGVIKPVHGRRAVTALQGSCWCPPDLRMDAVCHVHPQRLSQPRYSSCVLLMICFPNSLKGVVGGGRVGGKDEEAISEHDTKWRLVSRREGRKQGPLVQR